MSAGTPLGFSDDVIAFNHRYCIRLSSTPRVKTQERAPRHSAKQTCMQTRPSVCMTSPRCWALRAVQCPCRISVFPFPFLPHRSRAASRLSARSTRFASAERTARQAAVLRRCESATHAFVGSLVRARAPTSHARRHGEQALERRGLLTGGMTSSERQGGAGKW
jgi:hypothetical protein